MVARLKGSRFQILVQNERTEALERLPYSLRTRQEHSVSRCSSPSSSSM
jgi:hypothetical protein